MGNAFCVLGYFVGHAYTKVEHASGIASDVLLGLVVVAVAVLVHPSARREGQLDEGATVRGPRTPGASSTDRSPAMRPRTTRCEGAGGVVTGGVGVQPPHRPRRVAPVHAEDPETRLVAAPLVVVDQGPVQVRRRRESSATASATAPRCSLM